MFDSLNLIVSSSKQEQSFNYYYYFLISSQCLVGIPVPLLTVSTQQTIINSLSSNFCLVNLIITFLCLPLEDIVWCHTDRKGSLPAN